MQKSLLAVLWLSSAVFQAARADIQFITAGFSLSPLPILFATPDLIWTNTPVGQEFVPGLPRIEFIDVYFGGGGAAHYEILLHEGTITSSIVATSEVVFRTETNAAMTRFTFEPAASLSPGATYVLEFTRQEPMTIVEESPEIYRPGVDYTGGERIWRGMPEPHRDLYFRAGVFVRSLLSSHLALMVADGVARPLDPAAAFNNPYVTNFEGATLKWELSSISPDSISLANGGLAEIAIDAASGDIHYNSGGTSFGRVLTNVTTARSITVQFNQNADANAISAVIRSLNFTAPLAGGLPPTPAASSVIIVRPPLPRPIRSTRLQVTFTHPSGEAFESRVFPVSTPNTPPNPYIYVIGAQPFLSSGPLLITRRLEQFVSVECNTGGLVDGDGDPLTFAWWLEPETILSTLPRVTNNYSAGLHFVRVSVDDGTASASAETSFEVITPHDAIKRLRTDLAEKFSGRPPQGLEMPLRFAAYGIETREWSLASRQLGIFRKRLARFIDNEELSERWYDAAGQIKYAVAKLPRFGSPRPPGGRVSGCASSNALKAHWQIVGFRMIQASSFLLSLARFPCNFAARWKLPKR